MRARPLLVASAVLLVVGACSSYEPTVLEPTSVLTELRHDEPALPTDGLSPADAVALALVHNPRLRVARADHAIAEGLVLSETVWENPQLRPRLRDLYSGLDNPVQWAIDLRIFPPPPGRDDALRGRAEARVRRVSAELEAAEADVALETRLAHARLLLLDVQVPALEAAVRRHDRVGGIVERQIRAGVATRIEATLVELAGEELRDELEALRAQRRLAEAELAALLGAPSATALTVVPDAESSAARPPVEALEELALEREPTLRSLAELYREEEEALRLAHAERGLWPNFVSPGGGGESGEAFYDLDASIDLPLFDQGDEELALATLRRDRARDLFRARLHELRGALRRSVLELEESDRRRAALDERLGPLLERAQTLVRSVLDAGAADPVALIALETRVLDVRRAAAEASYEATRARTELERLTGGPLPAEGAPSSSNR